MSKRGRLALHFSNGAWSTHRIAKGEVDADDRLEPVFRDGEVLKTQTVRQIRERCAKQEPVILAT